MASQLLATYNAIAAIDISVNSVTLPVIGADQGKGTVKQTPTRILSPLHDRDENRGMSKITFGNNAIVPRVISDLCLYAPVTEGSGIEYYVPFLLEYQEAYENAVIANFGLGLRGVTVQNVSLEIGVYAYPAVAGKWYYGVKAEWSINEVL